MLSSLSDCSNHAVIIRHAERMDAVVENWKLSDPKFVDYPLDDCPLSERGLEQADKIADELALFKPRAIFVSPYERCIKTIGPAAAQHGWRMKIEPGIGETLDMFSYPPHYLYPFSIFKFYKEFKFDRKYAPVKKEFSLTPEFNFKQCDKRVRNVVNELMIAYGCKGIVYVTHRYVCSMITSMYTGESVQFEPGMMAFLKPVNKRWVVDYVVQP